jgi:hypothetical protein
MNTLDWHSVVGAIGGIIAFGAIIPYIKDILHGTTRPNTVSYTIWVLILVISIAAQVSAGASWSIIFLIGDCIGTFIILVLCFMGHGYPKYGWIEWACGALAIIAIVSWQITDRPILAIVFAIIADVLAIVPTIIKTYHDPWSELPTAWLLIAFASFLGIVSTKIFNGANLALPIEIMTANVITGLLALVGRRTRGS